MWCACVRACVCGVCVCVVCVWCVCVVCVCCVWCVCVVCVWYVCDVCVCARAHQRTNDLCLEIAGHRWLSPVFSNPLLTGRKLSVVDFRCAAPQVSHDGLDFQTLHVNTRQLTKLSPPRIFRVIQTPDLPSSHDKTMKAQYSKRQLFVFLLDSHGLCPVWFNVFGCCCCCCFLFWSQNADCEYCLCYYSCLHITMNAP